jgi:hypothetical protein
MAVGTLGVASWAGAGPQAHHRTDHERGRLLAVQLFFSIETRDARESAFSRSTFADWTFVATTGVSFFLIVMATVLGPCQAILKTPRSTWISDSSASPWPADRRD